MQYSFYLFFSKTPYGDAIHAQKGSEHMQGKSAMCAGSLCALQVEQVFSKWALKYKV